MKPPAKALMTISYRYRAGSLPTGRARASWPVCGEPPTQAAVQAVPGTPPGRRSALSVDLSASALRGQLADAHHPVHYGGDDGHADHSCDHGGDDLGGLGDAVPRLIDDRDHGDGDRQDSQARAAAAAGT